MGYLGTIIDLGELYRDLVIDQAEWSQKTFGSDEERGPLGALKHLEREAKEAQDNPNDRSEYADCLLLILDASRRAGINYMDLLKEAHKKMKINKERTWPTPTDDEPVEHIKD